MKVFVTGATGLVGAHTALALLQGGHKLRLLVRDAELARRYFDDHGHRVDDIVVVSLRDQDAVKQAMRGCDAVFHAAAAVSLDPNKAQETYDNNVGCTKAVMSAACELDIRHIVYVSSLSVLFHPGLAGITEATPLADCKDAYSRSKRDSDEYVRAMQQGGVPVQVTYPSAVVGPDDPRLSESNRALMKFVSQFLPLTTSGFQCVDVRDLGLAHRYLLEHPPACEFSQARYILGGHYYPWEQFRQRLEQLMGRRIFNLRLPPRPMRATGASVDFIKRLVPFQTRVSAEAMAFVTQWPPADSSRFIARSGLRFRPGEETFGDAIRWMVQAGHLQRKRAGRLAPA